VGVEDGDDLVVVFTELGVRARGSPSFETPCAYDILRFKVL
jgi:hypothetical protein